MKLLSKCLNASGSSSVGVSTSSCRFSCCNLERVLNLLVEPLWQQRSEYLNEVVSIRKFPHSLGSRALLQGLSWRGARGTWQIATKWECERWDDLPFGSTARWGRWCRAAAGVSLLPLPQGERNLKANSEENKRVSLPALKQRLLGSSICLCWNLNVLYWALARQYALTVSISTSTNKSFSHTSTDLLLLSGVIIANVRFREGACYWSSWAEVGFMLIPGSRYRNYYNGLYP